MKVSRTSRLNGEYQKEVSEIIRHLKDRAPDFKGLVSVTEADVAPDLKTAYIYVSIYGVKEEETKRADRRDREKRDQRRAEREAKKAAQGEGRASRRRKDDA